jgi:hypothetical protein
MAGRSPSKTWPLTTAGKSRAERLEHLVLHAARRQQRCDRDGRLPQVGADIVNGSGHFDAGCPESAGGEPTESDRSRRERTARPVAVPESPATRSAKHQRAASTFGV